MTRSIVAVAAVILGLGPVTAEAAPVTFDFEAETATALPRTGVFTSLSETNSGVTVTITRASDKHFDIVANIAPSQVKPAAFGLRSLDPFFDSRPGLFIASFSTPVSSVSIDLGDYGQDRDTLSLSAFSGANASGALLGSATDTLAADQTSTFTFRTLSLSAAGIQSITFGGTFSSDTTSTNDFTNSLFADNLTVNASTTVPEPATLVLLVSAMPIAALYRQTRRRHHRV